MLIEVERVNKKLFLKTYPSAIWRNKVEFTKSNSFSQLGIVTEKNSVGAELFTTSSELLTLCL